MATRTPTKPRRSRITPERAAELDAARVQKLTDALDALRTSDGWKNWLRTRKAFRAYSLNNQLLVALQAPAAVRVAGFKAWLSLGYCVREGEKAIRIYGPNTRKRTDKDPPGEGPIVTGFKLVPVFWDGQVKPLEGMEQAPLTPPETTLGGDVAPDVLEQAITSLADRLVGDGHARSVKFSDKPLPDGAGGYFVPSTKAIVVGPHDTRLDVLRVLIHEGVHALGVGYDQYGRSRAEAIVEASTYLVLDGMGVANTKSPSYIASWADDAPDVVRRDASTIVAHASTIETYLGVLAP